MAGFTFTFSKCNHQVYRRIDFYLANNIFNTLLQTGKQLDPDFKFINFMDINELLSISNYNDIDPKTSQFNSIGIKTSCNTGRHKIATQYSLDNCIFIFTYKDIEIKVLVYIPIDKTHV